MLKSLDIFYNCMSLIMRYIKGILSYELIEMEFILVNFAVTKPLVLIILYELVELLSGCERLVISHYTCVF